MTGGVLLGLQMLARDSQTAVIRKGVKFLGEHFVAEPPDWDRNCNLYTWVSATSALYNAGGPEWTYYQSRVLPQILKAQLPNGGFTAGRADWPASAAADPIYRQALCTLQLEVYYRYAK